jgi:hypothetical protein
MIMRHSENATSDAEAPSATTDKILSLLKTAPP